MNNLYYSKFEFKWIEFNIWKFPVSGLNVFACIRFFVSVGFFLFGSIDQMFRNTDWKSFPFPQFSIISARYQTETKSSLRNYFIVSTFLPKPNSMKRIFFGYLRLAKTKVISNFTCSHPTVLFNRFEEGIKRFGMLNVHASSLWHCVPYFAPYFGKGTNKISSLLANVESNWKMLWRKTKTKFNLPSCESYK